MLTTRVNEGSATIYQFPVGGRAALGGRRYGEAKAAVSEFAAPSVNFADSGSWYHAEAIQDAKSGRDH